MRTKEQIKEALDEQNNAGVIVEKLTKLLAQIVVKSIEEQIDKSIDEGSFIVSEPASGFSYNKVKINVEMPFLERLENDQFEELHDISNKVSFENLGIADVGDNALGKLLVDPDIKGVEPNNLYDFCSRVYSTEYQVEVVELTKKLLEQYYEQGLDINLEIEQGHNSIDEPALNVTREELTPNAY